LIKGFKTGCGLVVSVCITCLNVNAGRLVAQTTRPATEQTEEKEKTSTYDFWTSKTLTGDWGGVRTDLADAGLKIELSYQQQWQQNFKGGVDTHNAHRDTGTYDLVFKIDLAKLGLFENSGFYFKAKGSYGDGINDKVGALSSVNSDANGDHPIFVRKWWYWHKFLDDRVELRLGMVQSNKDLFDVSLYANHEDKDFLNRASVRNTTIPHATAIGAYLNVEPIDSVYFRAAAFDRQARPRRTGFDTAFHEEAWYIGFWEGGWTPAFDTAKGPMPGRYRIGTWLAGGDKDVIGSDSETKSDDMGFYIGADQMVWKENDDADDDQGLGLFARYGWADQDVNEIRGYWQAGASYCGLVPTRDDDIFGFSVSQSILSKVYRQTEDPEADRETVYEWYYRIQVTPWLLLTPDLQVITQPGGDKDDRNAIVGGVRLRVIF
jgi:porin